MWPELSHCHWLIVSVVVRGGRWNPSHLSFKAALALMVRVVDIGADAVDEQRLRWPQHRQQRILVAGAVLPTERDLVEKIRSTSAIGSVRIVSADLRLDLALSHEPIFDRIATLEAALLGALGSRFSDHLAELICIRRALALDDLHFTA
jgi:hypothetical protein